MSAGVSTIINAMSERSRVKAEGSIPRARAASVIAAHSAGQNRMLFGSRLSAWARGLRSGCGIAVPSLLAAGFLAVEDPLDGVPARRRLPFPAQDAREVPRIPLDAPGEFVLGPPEDLSAALDFPGRRRYCCGEHCGNGTSVIKNLSSIKTLLA